MSTTAVEVSGATTGEVRVPSVVDLVSRKVLVDGFVSTVTAVRPGVVFTEREPGVSKPDGQVVCLPEVGEAVTIRSESGESEVAGGVWLGLLSDYIPTHEDARVEALVLGEHGVRRVSVKPAQVEARQVVTGKASEEARSAHEALLATIRGHEEWKTSLAAAAHDEANDHDWCGEFDDFMDRVGLPRRVHDFDLRVEVTATVYLTRSDESLDGAIDNLTRQDVWDALGPSDLDWEAEQD